MSTQFALFKYKRFSAMFATQFLGAFNDNVFKQGLILVLTFMAAAKLGMRVSLLNNLAAMLFVLPFFLFSALAGQLADKYEKSWLTRLIKILEIVIMVVAAFGFVFEIYPLLFVALFLMGTHSTFFGPIKYAYLPQAMTTDELVGANGLFQMGTSLAILTGMMLAGVLIRQFFVQKHGWHLGKAAHPWPFAAAGGAILLALVVALLPSATSVSTDKAPAATFEQVQAIVQQRCIACHGAQVQMKNKRFDTAELIKANAQSIYQQVVVLRQMPMNNATGITESERQALGQWYLAGASGS